MDSLEKIDFEAAKSSYFDDAAAVSGSLSSDIAVLDSIKRSEFKERLDAFVKKLNSATQSRKIALGDRTRELLEEYEKILADYEGFESELPVLISREEKVLKELRPIMSDTSKNFRPHNIDSDRFEEITSKISTARSKYEKFGILREALLSSKDTYDYLAATIANRGAKAGN